MLVKFWTLGTTFDELSTVLAGILIGAVVTLTGDEEEMQVFGIVVFVVVVEASVGLVGVFKLGAAFGSVVHRDR